MKVALAKVSSTTAETKIILNLEDDEAERVQETLHLSDAETMEVTHFERGNGRSRPTTTMSWLSLRPALLRKT